MLFSQNEKEKRKKGQNNLNLTQNFPILRILTFSPHQRKIISWEFTVSWNFLKITISSIAQDVTLYNTVPRVSNFLPGCTLQRCKCSFVSFARLEKTGGSLDTLARTRFHRICRILWSVPPFPPSSCCRFSHPCARPEFAGFPLNPRWSCSRFSCFRETVIKFRCRGTIFFFNTRISRSFVLFDCIGKLASSKSCRELLRLQFVERLSFSSREFASLLSASADFQKNNIY